MKVLLLDIETAPMLGYSWDIWREQGSMKFIKKDWYMLCWCAKWLDEKEVMCDSLNIHPGCINLQHDKPIIKTIHALLDEADVVVTQNGIKFDIPKIYAKFIEHGMKPPSPFKNVDTCKIAKAIFGFSSNKLDDIGKLLGVGRKVDTNGFELWDRCMEDDPKAWKKMLRYCRNDVLLLERVYKKMLPFIITHPNRNYFLKNSKVCPKCGSSNLIKRGKIYLSIGTKQRYQCKKCGGWCAGDKIIKNI